jgi:hypothetical protein
VTTTRLARVTGVAYASFLQSNKIQIVYMHKMLILNGVLKDFLKKGDS